MFLEIINIIFEYKMKPTRHLTAVKKRLLLLKRSNSSSSTPCRHSRPVKFVSNGITVTVSPEMIQQVCHPKPPLTVSRGTQTDAMPRGGDGGGETAEDRLKRYGLVRKQLAVVLHSALCKIRDGLLEHSEEEANSVNKIILC